MPVLALETTSLVSSIAVAETDKLIGELTIQTRLTHSETLMPHIVQLLADVRISKDELTGVAISIGPGSFTGIRIGLATAKALVYALKIPLIGVSTMQAMASAWAVPGIWLAPIIDAQKGNVYYAVYEWRDGEVHIDTPLSTAPHTEVLQELSNRSRPVILMGDAANLYSDVIQKLGGTLHTAPPQSVMPSARNVAVMGASMLAAGVMSDPVELAPLYVRRSEAEELWEKRHGCRI